MSRIELKNCTVSLLDGLAGTAAVNQPVTPPAEDDVALTVDTIVLNTDITTKIPVGARFTIAGETDTDAIHIVTGRTQGPVAGVNEKQSVAIDVSSSGGHFHLSWGGTTTGEIAYNADNAAVKAALVAMDDGYTASDWDVTGGPGPDTAWVVEFKGALGNAPRALMTGDGTALTGGDTDVTVTQTQLGVVPVTSSTTVAIAFSPALGAGTYVDGGVLTFLSQKLEIKIGEGDAKWSEAKAYSYDLDRGELDTVRSGDETPLDLSITATFDQIKSGTSDPPTPVEAMKGSGGQADEWVNYSSDACEPYCVGVLIEDVRDCAAANSRDYLFADFRYEKLDFDIKAATIAVSGKCNITEPVISVHS